MSLERRGKFELIIAMVLSGTVGMFVLESGQPSYNAVFFRCLFGGGCLIAYCAFKGYLNFAELTKKHWLLIISSGVAVVLNWILLFESYKYASISVSTVVYHTQPLFLVFLAALFLREKLESHNLVWVLVALIGVVLIVDPSAANVAKDKQIYGLLFALAAAVLYAVATLIIKQLNGVKPHFIAAIQVSLGCMLLLPFVNFDIVPSAGEQWIWLVGLGVVHTCIMYILLYSSFQKVSTGSIAVLSYIYPGVAILVDYIFYDQNLSWVQIVGVGLIVIAGFSNNRNINVLKLIPRPSKT